MNSKNLYRRGFPFLLHVLVLLLSFSVQSQTRVQMETSMGTIKLVLYDATPLHRDNFIKLVKENYYDSLLFHRVINGFMIQGGDPDSRNAPSGTFLGEGGPEYTIPAEISPRIFHRKGVLAAARESDLDNPSRASSGSQFYIVQGRIFPDSILALQATRITKMQLFNNIINRPEHADLLKNYKSFAKSNQPDSVKKVYDAINKIVEQELPSVTPYEFTAEQMQAYSTIGGTPHLDGSYTVFGEVTEGLEVVDRIAEQRTDQNARPVDDIRILKVSIIP